MYPGTGQHPLRKHVFSYDQRDAKIAGDASTVIDEEDDKAGEPGGQLWKPYRGQSLPITLPPGRFRRWPNDVRRPKVQHLRGFC
jgi:hypothetical protein